MKWSNRYWNTDGRDHGRIARVGSCPWPNGGAASPKTPWGEPDLQGMWDTRTRAPFERPKEFGTKEFMTEAEAKDRLARGWT